MTKSEFAKLFSDALEIAAQNADLKLGNSVSRDFCVKLYGSGHSGLVLSAREAVEDLYLGPELFFRIIDLAVIKVSSQSTQVFVRASDHKASSFEETWNQPKGMGPFKQLISDEIEHEA